MPQSSPVVNELIKLWVQIAHLPNLDPRIQDAYSALILYLQRQYGIAITIPDNGIEAQSQYHSLDEILAKITPETDPKLLGLLQSVSTAVGNWQPSDSVGVSLESVKARLLTVTDILTSGGGVQITNSQFDESIKLDHIHTYSTDIHQVEKITEPRQTPEIKQKVTPNIRIESTTPPVVVLDNVKTGGGIQIGSITQTITQIFTGKSTEARLIRQRKEILSLVEEMWIKGILQPSLDAGMHLKLLLEPAEDLVGNHPFAEIVQMPDAPQLTIHPKDTIEEIFQQAQQRLLLLGEPGSGKTTLLLMIAKAMIAAARQDDTQPIPVILNLASWTPNHTSLASWVLAEMKDKYLIPAKIIEPWLTNDDLILLLDGLDEVNEVHRPACVTAINQFLGEYRIPMVVCCRTNEYRALGEQLRLVRALQIQPLTQAQIADYLRSAHVDQSGIAALIASDEQVRDLAQSPLVLHIMTVAAEQFPTPASAATVSKQEWLSLLFATYLSVMFHRRSGIHPYTPQQTIDWLSWLARQMMDHRQSIFLIEQMQPTLLVNSRQRILYQFAIRVAGSLLFLIGLPPIIFVLLLIYGATFSASFLGFGFSLLIGGIISIALILTSVIAGRVHTLLAIVLALCSLTTLLVVGMVAIPNNLTSENPISTAALIALIFGPMGSLPGIFLSGKHPIHPIRPVSWSWTRIRFAFLVGLVGAVIVGGLVGLLIGWENGIGIGSIVGFCCILPMSLFSDRLEESIQPSIYPNQGIRNSLYTATVVFVVITSIAGLLSVLWHLLNANVTIERFIEAITLGTILGIPIGISAALAAGGATSLRHYLLRCFLAWSGLLPWKLQHFLDYATERVFLSRVGGGYIFYHRLLMEYLVTAKETSNARTKFN